MVVGLEVVLAETVDVGDPAIVVWALSVRACVRAC